MFRYHTSRTRLVLIGLLFMPFLTGCAALKYTVKTQPDLHHEPQEYDRPETLLNGPAVVYRPASQQDFATKEMELLYSQAPIIVQGVEPKDKKKYPPDSDSIGGPELAPQKNGTYEIAVDEEKPVLFARVEKEQVYGRELTQLVYNYWYPRHPLGFAEKGHPDGGVLRVTLDAANRPAVYEYVWPCGCFHYLFVAEELEHDAQAEFGTLLPKKDRFTENAVKGRLNWNVQDLVRGARTGARPVLFVSAGEHKCIAMQTEAVVRDGVDLPSHDYLLEPYASLSALPVRGKPGATASIFNPQGLVWGGRRIGEEILFVGMMDHPGWPRHLDQVRIHWDEDDWNDPHLLGTFLRLPHTLVQPTSAITRNE